MTKKKENSGKKKNDYDPKKEWIGVDLDGTLAKDDGWQGIEHIGEPVDAMVRRVKRWRSAGKNVKIFTARVDDPDSIPYIKAWLTGLGLGDMEITNVKDRYMKELWDDRAKGVKKNQGVAENTAFPLWSAISNEID